MSVLLEQALSDSSDLLGGMRVWFGAVEVSASMRIAKVRWNCMHTEQDKIAQLQKELQRMGPKFRYAITQNIRLKYSPELVFIYDDGARERTRIETESALRKLEQLMTLEEENAMEPVPESLDHFDSSRVQEYQENQMKLKKNKKTKKRK
ncbi:MAG: ribosome-binding factor A [archaeon]|nr:ribosome-binding factor A [archaeon]